jgi:hypothetical protein
MHRGRALLTAPALPVLLPWVRVVLRRALESGAAGVVLAALTLMAGCATRPPVAIAVADFKDVAGAWRSTHRSALRASLIIQTNGKYWMAVERGGGVQGQLIVDGDVLRYDTGPAGSWRGTATLLDDRGKEYLRFTHETGQLWIECERGP